MSDFIEIARVHDLAHAGILQSKLESEGIEAFLENADLMNISGILPGDEGYVSLLVAAGDAAEARKILDLESHSTPSMDPEADGKKNTPESSSSIFIFMALALAVLSIYILQLYR